MTENNAAGSPPVGARRVDADYLASLVVPDRLPLAEAEATMADLADHLPKRIFKLERGGAR